MASSRTHLLSAIIYQLDSEVRNDLSKSLITSENDYTSALCTKIRDDSNYKPFFMINFFNNSHKLKPKIEQKFGCDALIIFKIGNLVKTGLFEAKWPRISSGNYRWDRLSKNISHFSSQINRQHQWIKSAAIWEMFNYEEPVGKRMQPFDRFGSTCVWHNVSYKYDVSRNTSKSWCNPELINMLKTRPTNLRDSDYGTNLRDMIYRLLCCAKGKKISSKNNKFLLKGDEEQIEIPLILEHNEQYDNDRLYGFMSDTGLRYYIMIEIEDKFEYDFE